MKNKIEDIKRNIFGWFLPIITMAFIFLLGDIFNLKGLFIIGITAIIPISFFIQGVICCRKKIGFFIPFIISLFTFFIVIMIYLNDSAIGYLMYYTVTYVLGYLLQMIISKIIMIIKK